MLKKPCPYHQGPVKHTLEECTMLRRYYAKLGLPNDDAKKKGAGNGDNDKDDGFPKVHNAFMNSIFFSQQTSTSQPKPTQKSTSEQAICIVNPTIF